VDMYPTLTELCQLPAYALAEGHSLVNFLTHPEAKSAHPAVSYYGEGNMSIRSERYRLIKYEDGSMELYDMEKDPNEWHNLAYDKTYQSVIKDLLVAAPEVWAPLSHYSHYSFNEYFIKKSDKK